MSIRKNNKRKNKPWECRWLEDGKHYSRSFPTRKDAEEFDAQRRSTLSSGVGLRTADAKVTFDDYAQKVLSQKRKASTALRNKGIYERHIKPVLGHVRLRAIRHSDIQQLINSWEEDGLSPRTISRQIAVLSKVFTLAERDGVINRIPTKGVERPEAKEPHRYSMSTSEVDEFIRAIHPTYQAFVYVLVETGMRIGEAIALKIQDFDWVNGTLRIPDSKTRAGIRTIRISSTAQRLVSAHVSATGRNMTNSTEPLFVSHRTDDAGRIIGTAINYSNFRSRIFKPAAIAIGLPDLQPHDLRRTAASLLVNTDTPQKVIQERLGHADIRTTLNLYAQATEVAHEEAVTTIEGLLSSPSENQSARLEQA